MLLRAVDQQQQVHVVPVGEGGEEGGDQAERVALAFGGVVDGGGEDHAVGQAEPVAGGAAGLGVHRAAVHHR